MTEETLNSTPDSLPLSQETINLLWESLQSSAQMGFLPECSSQAFFEAPPQPPPVQLARSSLPATGNWPGDFSFEVSFSPQEIISSSKQIPWTYSENTNKLYVRKDVACPINFSTRFCMTSDVCVRAKAVFTLPEHSSEAVHRCVNHSVDELQRNIFEAEHLIRCESVVAAYHKDPENQRHSVTIPYENPPAGQAFSTYIYKFVCFSSCSGGPNRRPLTLIFTLERGGIVIGRRSLDLKICASPGRDRKNDEVPSLPMTIPPTLPKKQKLSLDGFDKENEKNMWPFMPKKQRLSVGANVPKVTDRFGTKKRSLPAPMENKRKFVIEVEDEACYMFLMNMKNFYEMRKALKKMPPEYRRYFRIVRSSSDEESSSQ